MNNLIEIQVNENQEQTISGRELHMFLGVDTKYNDWIQRMLQYGFEDGQDFNLLKKEQVQIEGKREVRREIADHIMKLDMAKELCMLTRNEKGKQARHYFLEVERDWNSPEKVMARALVIANKQIDTLKLENTVQRQVIAEFKPIKEYVDTILSSEDTVTITQIAADYGLSAKALNKILNEQGLIRKVGGQWVLYSNHMQKGYTKSETIDVTRSDGSIKVVMNTKWTQKGRLKIHELLTLLGLKANMDKTAA
ncbi:phage antirepressor KilAC domain-containing protein [Phascolarctobacterium faecium]|mgnify:FL=1|jgi:anti-repressor protein